jgi:hypothetical protein
MPDLQSVSTSENGDFESKNSIQDGLNTSDICTTSEKEIESEYQVHESQFKDLYDFDPETFFQEVQSFLAELDTPDIEQDINMTPPGCMGPVLVDNMTNILEQCIPFPRDMYFHKLPPNLCQFSITQDEFDYFIIYDHLCNLETCIHPAQLCFEAFSFGYWYAAHCNRQLKSQNDSPHSKVTEWLDHIHYIDTTVGQPIEQCVTELLHSCGPHHGNNSNDWDHSGQFPIHVFANDVKHLYIQDFV